MKRLDLRKGDLLLYIGDATLQEFWKFALVVNNGGFYTKVLSVCFSEKSSIGDRIFLEPHGNTILLVARTVT